MRKRAFAVLLCVMAMLFCVSVYATDLPIDISAIGRQGVTGPVTPRIGAHLFTDDAQRINDLLAEEVLRRHETAGYLFAAVPSYYTPDPHDRIMTAAGDMALFSQPSNFSGISIPQESEDMPLWFMALIFAACAAAGFVLALMSRARKRRRQADVH